MQKSLCESTFFKHKDDVNKLKTLFDKNFLVIVIKNCGEVTLPGFLFMLILFYLMHFVRAFYTIYMHNN